MIISILVPTRKRLPQLKAMINSFYETVGDINNAELIFRCDDDDIITIEYLISIGAKFICGQRLKGYKSLPYFFNEMVKISSGHMLMCGNDDMLFLTPNWPILILEEAHKYPDGIFNFGVNAEYNDEVFPFSIISKRFVEIMGFINDERLLYSDLFLRDVMQHFGRALYLSHIHIEHKWMGETPDQTRQEADGHEREVWSGYKMFSPEYQQKHNLAVKEAIAKIVKATA